MVKTEKMACGLEDFGVWLTITEGVVGGVESLEARLGKTCPALDATCEIFTPH